MRFKKFMALSLATACVLPYGVVAHAEGTAPSASDRASIIIKGVEDGATVKAYQIVEANYNQYGLIDYSQTGDSSAKYVIKDIEKIKDTDVTTLSSELYKDSSFIKAADTITLEYDKTTGNYFTKNAEAGSYIVLVETSKKDYVYNPIYVSNAYTDAGDASTLGKQATNGTADVNAANTMVSSRQGIAYAKKKPVTLDKKIVDSSVGIDDAEDVQVGDTVTFEITTLSPDYSETFKDLTFKITDTQSKGLSVVLQDNIDTVFTYTFDEDGSRVEKEIPSENYAFTFETGDGNDWVIDFERDWLIGNPVSNIGIRYHATVTEDAVLATDANTNKAELDYSTLANGETGHLEDQVQIYTFKFDEAIKVGEEGAITVNEDKKVVAVSDALEGARFSLTGVTDRNGKDISSKVFYTNTDETGAIVFTGLDEGKYLLQEIEAPEGYFLNPTVFTVDVNATYKDEYIDYYTIKVTNNDTKEEVTSIYYSDPNLEDNVNGTGIVDTELSKLPSTGGMGNILFSVAGGVLFIGGAAILFMPKRKKAERE